MLVFRTCNGEINALPRSYHSGETEDLDFVISRLIRENPQSRFFLIGISLGGNVLLKWLGELGAAVPPQIAGAAAVSVPFDLARSSRHIGLGFARLYQWHFLRLLRAKALAKIARHPHIADAARVSSSRTLWDFDDAFTSVVHGFRNAADYYARSSSLGFLERIRVATLLLSARDDPFHPPAVLSEVEELASRNPALLLEFVDHGGHVGFVAGANPLRPEYYLEDRLLEVASQRLDGSRPASTPAAMERALTASYDLQV
jgi:predicted alpha/beta-fold hydrolase